MEISPCPLDKQFSDQIAALLAPPSPRAVQDYHDILIKSRECRGIGLKYHSELGKGVYANMKFKEGDLIMKDQMLVAAQHSSNKVDCLVCSYCFRYIGSIELQIGRKLYLQGLGQSGKKDCCYMGTSEEACPMDLLDEEQSPIRRISGDVQSSSSSTLENTSIPNEILESLMHGDLFLPHTKQFDLPSIIGCPGGCEEEHYCSKLCADSDWESVHSILCTGGSSKCSRSGAIVKFIEHANRTNDIFIVAAKAIAFTISRYKKLKSLHIQGSEQLSRSSEAIEHGFSLLLEAWKPMSMGFKRRWWDCIALPEDVDCSDEASFRTQIRDLAYTSLQLLKEAVFDIEYAPLLSLEVYGHLIGMFELNNLDLVVASPIEDYFIYIDDLPSPKKEEAEKLTLPYLDALGDDYSVCCQGTAFFPLQSCMNHSCIPNGKAFKRDQDRDGQATIIALRPISPGEEITISYIDEDLPYEERQALLADYGFKCRCQRCMEEHPDS